ncbi:MAG: hypothetical protein H2045_09405 [Rhizobiales bacterium]|nr:hypothetical protein [Hyphomicrobiales bacterium]
MKCFGAGLGAALMVAASIAPAGAAGSSIRITDPMESNIVQIKRCTFYHPDGYKYKDECPSEFDKGSRKKRAAIGAGVGAGTGAIIGAIAGGGRGAVIGAGVGAGAGAVGGALSVKKCWYFDNEGRKVKVKCNQSR